MLSQCKVGKKNIRPNIYYYYLIAIDPCLILQILSAVRQKRRMFFITLNGITPNEDSVMKVTQDTTSQEVIQQVDSSDNTINTHNEHPLAHLGDWSMQCLLWAKCDTQDTTMYKVMKEVDTQDTTVYEVIKEVDIIDLDNYCRFFKSNEIRSVLWVKKLIYVLPFLSTSKLSTLAAKNIGKGRDTI